MVATMAELHPLFSEFVPQGSLVFDIGASHGTYAQMFMDLGARRVIALEPMLSCKPRTVKEELRQIRNVIGIGKAVSSSVGKTTIKVNRHFDYCQTIDKDWVENSAHKDYYSDPDSLEEFEIETTTLDELIREFGVPSFIKIDVEGHGREVIRGLNQPVNALNFEFHKDWLGDATESVRHLDRLGHYVYNYVFGTSGEFALETWVDGKTLLETLHNTLDDSGPRGWGDAWAKLVLDK